MAHHRGRLDMAAYDQCLILYKINFAAKDKNLNFATQDITKKNRQASD